MPDEPAAGPRRPSDRSLSLVQREVALVVVLCVAGTIMFVATRSLAEWTRDTSESTAVSFYDRGQQLLAEGSTEEGLAALRKAVAADRANVAFTLALARALSEASQDEEAWQILQRLRQDNPEDAEINYRLARLARVRGEPDLAVRYYNHALYGVQPEDAPVERRRVQTELAGLYLDMDDAESASALLGLIARDLPDVPEPHLEVAHLYQRAGDWRQALRQFEAALKLEPESTPAMLGAADTAFELGDFPLTARYLEQASAAGAERQDLAGLLALVRLVVASDPLASGLTMTNRVTRLRAGLEWAGAKLEACVPPDDDPDAVALATRLTEFRGMPRQDLRDTDVLVAGIDLIARVEDDVRRRCGATDAAGEAWTIIKRARSAVQ